MKQFSIPEVGQYVQILLILSAAFRPVSTSTNNEEILEDLREKCRGFEICGETMPIDPSSEMDNQSCCTGKLFPYILRIIISPTNNSLGCI